MPGFSSPGIFISYRRQDSAAWVRLLQSELTKRIPGAPVFVDLDSIEAGWEFAEVIREALYSCAVLVAMIGRQWETLVDEEGRPRLDNPDDYVRFEVRTALERGVRVIRSWSMAPDRFSSSNCRPNCRSLRSFMPSSGAMPGTKTTRIS